MSFCPDHRLVSRTLPFALAALACALALAASTPASASASSPYPAGATRPAHIAKPSEYARAATTAPTGGSTAPASGSSKSAGNPSKSTSGSSKSTGGSSKSTSKSKPKPKPKPVLHGNPARALAAFEAMQRVYYIPGSGLYQGEPFSFLWPFSQALAATVTLNNMTGIGIIPGLKLPRSSAKQTRASPACAPTSTPTTRAPPKGRSRARSPPSTAPSRRPPGRAGRVLRR